MTSLLANRLAEADSTQKAINNLWDRVTSVSWHSIASDIAILICLVLLSGFLISLMFQVKRIESRLSSGSDPKSPQQRSRQ